MIWPACDGCHPAGCRCPAVDVTDYAAGDKARRRRRRQLLRRHRPVTTRPNWRAPWEYGEAP